MSALIRGPLCELRDLCGEILRCGAGLAAALLGAPFAGAAEPAPADAPPARPGRLELRLVDHETRLPTAALVRFSGGGRDWGPAGPGGWFAVEGRTELELPPGEYRLRVDGGRRRLPYDARARIAPGATESRTVYLLMPGHLAF